MSDSTENQKSTEEDVRFLLSVVDRGFVRVQDRPLIDQLRDRVNAQAPRCDKTIDIFGVKA